MPDPLVTVADLSAYTGRDLSADDAALVAVDFACDTIRDVAGQTFNAGTATWELDGSGTDVLTLPELPAAVSAVSVAGSALETTDYMLDRSGGLLFRGSAGIYPRPVWPEGRQNISVAATHGYESAEVPRSVRGVALALANRYVVQGAALEETLGSSRVKYAGASTELLPGELRILRQHQPT